MKLIESPLFRFVLFFTLGLAAAPYFPFSELFWGLYAMLFVILWALKRHSQHPFARLCFSVMLYMAAFGVGIGTYWAQLPTRCPRHYIHLPQAQRAVVELQTPLRSNARNQRWVAQVRFWHKQEACGTIIVRFPKTYRLAPQQRWAVQGTFWPLAKQLPDEGFDYNQYLYRKHWLGQWQVTTALQQVYTPSWTASIWSFKRRIAQHLQGAGLTAPDAALLMALLFGEQTEVDPEAMVDYQKAGIVHILSVSGMHVGFVVMLVRGLTRWLGHSRMAKGIQHSILIMVLLAFGCMAQWAPPVLRAIGMVLWMLIGQWMSRPVWSLQALTALWFLILLAQPQALYDLSLQLSFSAIIGICMFQPFMSQWYKHCHWGLRYLGDALSLSIAAQLGTLPLCLYYFHQFPLYFLLANLAILPLLGLLMVVALTGAVWAFFAPPAPWWAHVAHLLIEGMNAVASHIAAWPYSILSPIPCSAVMALWFGGAVMLIWHCTRHGFRYKYVLLWLSLGGCIQLISDVQTACTSEWRIVQLHRYSAWMYRRGFEVRVYTNMPAAQWKQSDIWRAFAMAHQGVRLQVGPLVDAFSTPKGMWLAIDHDAPMRTKCRPVYGLWLRQKANIHLPALLARYRPQMVVIDGSNPNGVARLWQQRCTQNGVPCHWTRPAGSYRETLD